MTGASPDANFAERRALRTVASRISEVTGKMHVDVRTEVMFLREDVVRKW